MNIYLSETISPSSPPSTSTCQATKNSEMYVDIQPNATQKAEQHKNKMSHTKWIYGLCIIAFATIATVSLIFAVSAFKSNEAQGGKLQIFTSHFQAMEKKLDGLDSLAKLSEGLQAFVAKNCYDLEKVGVRTSGVYKITVANKITEVYCDMETDGGGWTVMQRRVSDAVHFFREWTSYVVGFGNLSGNFWLGLDRIHEMTSSQSYQLRVDIEDFSGNQAYAIYNSFSIESESYNYRLNISGYEPIGDAGDSLTYHNNQPFTTKDRDNDARSKENCAQRFLGAWWYKDCYYSNLNGNYYSSGVNSGKGIRWNGWKIESLKRVEMKIKPN